VAVSLRVERIVEWAGKAFLAGPCQAESALQLDERIIMAEFKVIVAKEA
jgi:hypothetical protein